MRKFLSSAVLSVLFAANVLAQTAVSDTQQTTQQITAATGATQQTTVAPFSDVPQTHPNYVAINFLRTQGILGGYSDGTFKPGNQVNRAEALKILLVGNKVQVDDGVAQVSFKDMQTSDWFARYVEKAKSLGIVNGNPDGTFAPSRTVTRAEFLKMLLILNGFKTEQWTGKQMFADVPKDSWFTPYMNYAGQAGVIAKDDKNNVYPGQALTRGDVAEIMYLMIVIRSDKNTQFLIDQTEAQMGQIETYIGGNNVLAAKRASSLAVDFSQQALVNMPTNNVVLAAAKLAKAYDFLMNSFIAALKKDILNAKDWAMQAIAKATEAWQANHDIQPIAKHIKDRANEILNQLNAPASSSTQQTSGTTTP